MEIRNNKRSAGLLLYREQKDGLEVFLVHPGGPIFAHRNNGSWGIPKGEFEEGEVPIEVALREFEEETGQPLERCAECMNLVSIGEVRQKGGKVVSGWAVRGDWPEGAEFCSNTFQMEWPPHSGRMGEFPEVDQGGFFALAAARRKIKRAQEPFLDRLVELLRVERAAGN